MGPLPLAFLEKHTLHSYGVAFRGVHVDHHQGDLVIGLEGVATKTGNMRMELDLSHNLPCNDQSGSI